MHCWNAFERTDAMGNTTGGIAILLSSTPFATTEVSASPVAFRKNVTAMRPTNAETTYRVTEPS